MRDKAGRGSWYLNGSQEGKRETMLRVCRIVSSKQYVPRHNFCFGAQFVSSDPDIRTEQSIQIWIGADKIYKLHRAAITIQYGYIGQAE